MAHRNCDIWKEPESEWHRRWKNEFPEDWREVIIDIEGERHIADIQTPNGLILELQNSYISDEEIEKRESFYKNIVWLLNANSFKDHFKIRSIVNLKLRILDSNYTLRSQSKSESQEMKQFKLDLESVNAQISNAERELSNGNFTIKRVTALLENNQSAVPSYLGSLYDLKMAYEFEGAYQEELSKCENKIKNIESSLQEKYRFIQEINSLVICKIDGLTIYRYIDKVKVKPSSYSKCLFIKSETVNSLFPDIAKPNSEREFDQLARNPKYQLIIDITEAIERLEKQVADLEAEIQANKETKRLIFQKVSEERLNSLMKQKEECTIHLQATDTKLHFLRKVCAEKEIAVEELMEKEFERDRRAQVRSEKEYREQRSEIMRNYKGLYTYWWQHRRKSWDEAAGTIFFDFEDHIFEKVSDSELRKHSKEDFIAKITNW